MKSQGPVTLVEVRRELLAAHAHTLQRLAALFGEEAFFELLEQGDDEPTDPGVERNPRLTSELLSCFVAEEPGGSGRETNAYQSLEGAVQEFELPEVLEFHLWAYPSYRALIESPLGLHARVREGNEPRQKLVELITREAERWVRALPLPPAVAPRAESAAQVPWLRFRTELLKRLGQRPMGAISPG